MKRRRYSDLFRDEDEVDPRSSLMNLFDAAMVRQEGQQSHPLQI